MEKISGLGHLFMTVFLYNFSIFMVIPAITDVTMSALCPGEDECSLAIYLTGIQQATVTSMVCEGSVHCLALAYVVSASVAAIATVYMRVLLPESMADEIRRTTKEEEVRISLLDEDRNSRKNQVRVFKTMPSFDDTVSLLRSSLTFSQAAIVAFFTSLGDVGLHAALLYYLKAKFHFSKDQFADLMVINGISGTISQMVLMPILAPVIGEEKLLSMGLFFNCTHILLYSIAWAPWVPYASAMISLLAVFAHPCIRSIVSKQVGPGEQGKAQGCISGLCSFANAVSPFAFTPLTALFLSANAPFHFPGFSIACAGFAVMIAFVQSIMIRAVHPSLSFKVSNYSCVAEP
ncbi:hypothetical protein RHMOL_Rhmol07G0316400 [Rhododendron molle]|uniref:Uncharacterized protein n=1 Tax=Rhododendron molle TaxID=49168 RepID=A0ACC0N6N8_RHOML|nr:hypothetical protein RHMOL_Rhmol07G0316400 [Rhododendron molle]